VSSTGPTTVTIPATLAPGTYFQLACADDKKVVAETNEENNCTAASGTIAIVLPDLRETAVSAGPGLVAPGGKVTVTDTVENPSGVSAAASTTRYYLSPDAVKDAGDVLLTGTRPVASLLAGTSSTGSKQVTVPTSTPVGTYRVLACADDLKKVRETDETNNCLASAGTVQVEQPDLVTPSVSGPAAGTVGQKVTLTDTVVNQGSGPAGASSTRYYLSPDAVWSAGDVLLTGTRAVVALAPGGMSTGSKPVTVPAATPSGTYYMLACADDLKKVTETDEGNNCVASASTIVIGP
jgi:subtilase family serine protease